MAEWQYAQLTFHRELNMDGTVISERRPLFYWKARWHGPDGSIDDNPERNPDVLQLLNRAGQDGWELASVSEDREFSYMADQLSFSQVSDSRYTFKRPRP